MSKLPPERHRQDSGSTAKTLSNQGEVRKSLQLRHAPDRARTDNLQFRRLSLYPVELRVPSTAEVDHMAQPVFGKAKNGRESP